MATVTKPIALDESINTTELTPRNIADVLAEELKGIADNILPPNASQIAYDNTASGLTATNVQDAIDEVISSQANVIADTMADLTENKTATVTDGVADFETIDGSLVKSLVVEIEPSQSGSGTPSPDNIRPITGYTEEDTWIYGRNLLPNRLETLTKNGVTVTKNNDGTYTFNGTATAQTDFYINNATGTGSVTTQLRFGRDGRYLYSGITGGSNTTYRLYVAIKRADGTTTYGGINDGQGGFDSAYNESVDIFVRIYNGYTCNNVVIKPMLRLRAYIDDTTFYPYIGKTYTTAFGQTVYGGTLDVLTGELTIDTATITLNGTENWYKFQTTNKYYVEMRFPSTAGDTSRTAISNLYPFGSWISGMSDVATDNSFYLQNSNGRVAIMDDDYTTIDALKAMLSANNMEIVYPLATPTTLSLTPQTVKSLVGENHISASTGDVLQCKYSMLINGDDLAQLLS